MTITLILFISILFGLMASCVASFAFVVGERPARGEDLITNNSYCVNCGKPLRPVDNIPVFGWLFNKGKAYCCGAKIPSEYFYGELFIGLLGGYLAFIIFNNFGHAGMEHDVVIALLTILIANITLAVWWRLETVQRQYESFNVYIEPERVKDPIEEAVVNDPKTLYLQAKLMTRKK